MFILFFSLLVFGSNVFGQDLLAALDMGDEGQIIQDGFTEFVGVGAEVDGVPNAWQKFVYFPPATNTKITWESDGDAKWRTSASLVPMPGQDQFALFVDGLEFKDNTKLYLSELATGRYELTLYSANWRDGSTGYDATFDVKIEDALGDIDRVKNAVTARRDNAFDEGTIGPIKFAIQYQAAVGPASAQAIVKFQRKQGTIQINGLKLEKISPIPNLSNLVGQSALWKYAFDKPGFGDEWAQAGFNESGWSFGPSPFGYGVFDPPEPRSILSTFADQQGDVWYRNEFTLGATVDRLESLVLFQVASTQGVEVYLNGQMVYDDYGSSQDPKFWNSEFAVTGDELVDGLNQLAVRAKHSGNRMYFELQARALLPNPPVPPTPNPTPYPTSPPTDSPVMASVGTDPLGSPIFTDAAGNTLTDAQGNALPTPQPTAAGPVAGPPVGGIGTVGDDCTPGEQNCRCDGSTCLLGLECASLSAATGNVCLPAVCVPGTNGCQCDAEGACSAAGVQCDSATSVCKFSDPAACTPGSAGCQCVLATTGGSPANGSATAVTSGTCSSSGGVSGSPLTCRQSVCVQPGCEGQAGCPCSSDEECAPGGMRCVSFATAAAVEAAGSAVSGVCAVVLSEAAAGGGAALATDEELNASFFNGMGAGIGVGVGALLVVVLIVVLVIFVVRRRRGGSPSGNYAQPNMTSMSSGGGDLPRARSSKRRGGGRTPRTPRSPR